MTPDEIKRVAEEVAQKLAAGAWVPGPVRPTPPGRPTPGQLPPWAGAAQTLPDVATGRRGQSGRHRPAYDALTAATRAAAAGKGASPLPGGKGGTGKGEGGMEGGGTRTVKIGVSNRHLHLSPADVEKLFGTGAGLGVDRPITQPGQFAARERVRVVGPKGSIDGVRIVGPPRGATQLELAATDCRTIGVAAPVARSGALSGSAGGVKLEGPKGAVELATGVITAARHMHCSAEDAQRLGFADGDIIRISCGKGARRVVFDDVLVRAGPTHATEVHLDTDEAAAAGVQTGDMAEILGRPWRVRRPSPGVSAAASRRLVTERDVSRLAAQGVTFSSDGPFLLTPAARDRAKALGLWRD